MRQPQRLVPSDRDRISSLERRAEDHEKVIKPMADQVAEMYALLQKARTINWFVVKIFVFGSGALGFVAVVLTIVANVVKLATGH